MEKEKSIDEKLDIILRQLNEILSKLDRPVRTLDDEPKNPPTHPPGGG